MQKLEARFVQVPANYFFRATLAGPAVGLGRSLLAGSHWDVVDQVPGTLTVDFPQRRAD